MATTFSLALDTTVPGAPSIVLAGGASLTNLRDVIASIGTSDGDTTGYQIKVWGAGIDLTADPQVQATEANSTWVSFNAAKTVRLSNGDGVKSVSVRIRDDVWNESGVATDTITLDTSAPVPNVTSGPTAAKVSKVAGKRSTQVTWQADGDLAEYKFKVVPSGAATHDQGTTIGTAAGSANVAAVVNIAAATSTTTTIDGADLESASPGDGAKIVKLFVRDAVGNWSV